MFFTQGTCSNSERIICDTPKHAASGALYIKVTVDRKYALPLTSAARFQYVADVAGSMVNLAPFAGHVSTILNVQTSGTKEDLDYYKHIMVDNENKDEKSVSAVCRIDGMVNYWRMRYLPTDLLGPEHSGGSGSPTRSLDTAHVTVYQPNHIRCQVGFF